MRFLCWLFHNKRWVTVGESEGIYQLGWCPQCDRFFKGRMQKDDHVTVDRNIFLMDGHDD